jgi:hypothetical protein
VSSAVRPLRVGDIPQVVTLRRKAFRLSERPTDAGLGEAYERVFLHNPWYDDALPSLVYEDTAGRVRGFLGVMPRPMRFEGRAIRGAISTEFMVDPESGPSAGAQLLGTYLNGPQDLSISDRANDKARALFHSLGGSMVLWYSVYWARPLSAMGAVALEPLGRGVTRPVRDLMRILARTVDAAAAGVGLRRRARPHLEAREEDLDAAAVVTHLGRVTREQLLAPDYDVPSVAWLFDRLAERRHYGELRKVKLVDPGTGVIGWFVYYVKSGGRAELMQLAAVPGREHHVLEHLVHRAGRDGAVVLGGRLDPQFVGCFADGHYSFSVGQPWTILHSRHPELVAALQGGRAWFSRLDSEWWMSF